MIKFFQHQTAAIDGINWVLRAVGKDNARASLKYLACIEVHGKRCVVAADGRRLHAATVASLDILTGDQEEAFGKDSYYEIVMASKKEIILTASEDIHYPEINSVVSSVVWDGPPSEDPDGQYLKADLPPVSDKKSAGFWGRDISIASWAMGKGNMPVLNMEYFSDALSTPDAYQGWTAWQLPKGAFNPVLLVRQDKQRIALVMPIRIDG